MHLLCWFRSGGVVECICCAGLGVVGWWNAFVVLVYVCMFVCVRERENVCEWCVFLAICQSLSFPPFSTSSPSSSYVCGRVKLLKK